MYHQKFIFTYLQTEDLTSIDEEDGCQLELSSTECLTYEYHVVYSHSYNVPVLYFNVYHQSKVKNSDNFCCSIF